MSHRRATLVALGAGLAVLAAAGVLVAWHPWRQGDATPAPPIESADFVTILSVPQTELRSVELVTRVAALELVQTDGVWRLTKPADLAVKSQPLNDLMYSLANLVSERVVERSPASLEPYGLNPPSVTIRATTVDGEVRLLYLGDRTPAADSYYLMSEGDPRVFTVREHHGEYFHYGVEDFWVGRRDPIDGSNITALRIDRLGSRYLEIRRTEDLYRSDLEFRGTTLSVVYPWVDSPKPVDLTFLTAFVTSFAGLSAEVAVDVAPQDVAKYGLDSPAYSLAMEDGGGGRLRLDVGNPRAQETYLRFDGDPTVYAGDPKLFAILEVDPFRFVSRYAAIVRLNDVDRLAIAAGPSSHLLEVRRPTPGSEEGAAWMVDGRPVTMQAFKDFYTFAISLQVDALHDEEVAGTPELTLTYSLNTGRTLTVRFVPRGQEFYAVTKNGTGDVLVNRQQVRVLLENLEKLIASSAR